MDSVAASMDMDTDIDVAAFSSTILASLLEVDITEGSGEVKTKTSVSPGGTVQKKQPRKKTTNKPNPALLHLERQRMEEIKKNDAKLKMKVVVKLKRAEEEYEVARKWIEEQEKIARENVEKHKFKSKVDNVAQSTDSLKGSSDKDDENMDGNKDINTPDDSKMLVTETNEANIETPEDEQPNISKNLNDKETIEDTEDTNATADEGEEKTKVLIENDSKSSELIPAEETMEITEMEETLTAEATANVTPARDNAGDVDAPNEDKVIDEEPDNKDGKTCDKASTESDSVISATKADDKVTAEKADKDSIKTDSVLPAEQTDIEIAASKAEDSDKTMTESGKRGIQVVIGANDSVPVTSDMDADATNAEEVLADNSQSGSENAPKSLSTCKDSKDSSNPLIETHSNASTNAV
ncbi:hypothetical protein ACLKA6_010552 [Drosophila palustris]